MTHVRLRNGIGWIDRKAKTVVPPPDGDTFAVARTAERSDGAQAPLPFHVAETPRPVAIGKHQAPFAHGEEEEIARQLLDAGFPLAVSIELEADGAAVAHVYTLREDGEAFEDAARGLWALKALGGWDESPVMTFHLTHLADLEHAHLPGAARLRRGASVTARAQAAAGPIVVDVRMNRPEGWNAIREHLSRASSPFAVILADVDWAQAYNDAYGFPAGDLLLARVQSCIEALADDLDGSATVFRLSGDDLAVVVEGHSADVADQLAERIRAGVEAMNIPFQHREVRTHGRATVSVAAVMAVPSDASQDIHAALVEAVRRAKHRGRNARLP